MWCTNGLPNGTSSAASSRDPVFPRKREQSGGEVINFRYATGHFRGIESGGIAFVLRRIKTNANYL